MFLQITIKIFKKMCMNGIRLRMSL